MPTAKNKSKRKKNLFEHYAKMSLAELREATAEFDREFAIDEFREPTAEEQAKFQKFKRRGRPVVGGGAVRISLTIESNLLELTDKTAKKAHMKRSQIVGIALRKLIASESAAARLRQ
jgi:hypothetical protein